MTPTRRIQPLRCRYCRCEKVWTLEAFVFLIGLDWPCLFIVWYSLLQCPILVQQLSLRRFSFGMRALQKVGLWNSSPLRQSYENERTGESVALLVARRTNNQPTIGRLRVRGLKYVCITVLTGNRMGWTARCGRPSLLLPSVGSWSLDCQRWWTRIWHG